MALDVAATPVKFAPAYKPVEWSFTSGWAPVNTTAGETSIPILEIRRATATDIASYFGVSTGDVLMQFASSPGVLYQFQQFEVFNTDTGLYLGLQRVRRYLTDSLVVIDAEWVGDETGGKFNKVYERYVMIAEVTFSGLPDPVRYEIKAGPDGRFTINLQDAAQRGFQDILSHVDCRPGTQYTTVAEGENYITQTYSIKIFHGYMVTGPDGEFYFAEISKGVQRSFPPRIVVNAVQPDNHVDIDGDVDLSWQDNLTGYLMHPTLGGLGRKFLTYGPQVGQVVGEDDDAFLAFLFDERPNTPLRLMATTYDADGTPINNLDYQFGAPLNSGVIAIGPRNLGTFITDDAESYSLQIRNLSGGNVSIYMTYYLDRNCGEAYIRPQALNPLGGIDSIGLNVREKHGMQVERFITSKPNMEVTTSPLWTGDYNSRTWSVDMARTYGVSSKPQSAVNRKWFGENIFVSPDVRIPINDSRWTPIIITTREIPLYTSEEKPSPIRFDFILGTDNIRQRR